MTGDPNYEVGLEDAPQSPSIPHSREAEEAVLGAVMIDPDVYHDLAQFLYANDFFIHRNRFIWEAFTKLHEKRIPIDLLTLCEELEQVNQLAEIGGSAFLTSLVNQVPSSLNAESYGRIVEGHSIRRKMINSANEIARLAYREDIDAVAAYNQGLTQYQNVSTRNEDFLHISVLLSNEYDKMDDAQKGIDEEIVPTGYTDLDRLLDGGLRPVDLMYLAGRPGMGKTASLLDIVLYAAKPRNGNRGKRVATFSLEMSNEQVTQRLIAKYGIPFSDIRRRRLNESDWAIYTHAIEEASSLNIYMNDVPAINPMQIRSKCFSLHNRYGLDLIVIDYVQLMTDGKGRKGENKNNEVTYISNNLKILARELEVPVLCAAQLNRSVEQRSDKRPVLSDLRDSGSLEQDGDIIGFLYRDDYYNGKSEKAGITELIVAKQRNGPTGTIELVNRAQYMKFEDVATKISNQPAANHGYLRNYTDN